MERVASCFIVREPTRESFKGLLRAAMLRKITLPMAEGGLNGLGEMVLGEEPVRRLGTGKGPESGGE